MNRHVTLIVLGLVIAGASLTYWYLSIPDPNMEIKSEGSDAIIELAKLGVALLGFLTALYNFRALKLKSDK